MARHVRTGLAVAAVAGLAFAVHAYALRCGFVVDDLHQIVGNPWVEEPGHLREVFSNAVWDFEGRSSSYYRPMMYVAYRAAHLVAGRAPWAYHLLNLVLHSLASALVLLVAARMPDLRAGDTRAPPWAAVLAGALFALHPVHTEAVAWAAGIVDVGYAAFSLLALWLYVSSRRAFGPRSLLGAVSFLVACLFKEPALSLPLVLVAYEVFHARTGPDPRRSVARLVPFAIAGGVYVALRVHALGGLTREIASTGMSAGSYAVAAVDLMSAYLVKLVVPTDLNFWHVFVPPAALLSREAARAAVVAAMFVAVAAASFRRGGTPAVGIVALVAPLLPVLNFGALNQGIANAFTERYLYLPSFGFVLVVAYGAVRLRSRRPTFGPALAGAAIGLAAAYGAATVLRVPVWRDGVTLWSDAARKSPRSAVAHANRGYALIFAGRRGEGQDELRRAVGLDPTLPEQEMRKGALYASKGLRTKAILAFHAALALDPGLARAHYDLGLVYERGGLIDLAIREYEATLALDPADAAAHNNLGVLLAQRGDLGGAREHFREAVRLRPDDPDYTANLARAEAE